MKYGPTDPGPQTKLEFEKEMCSLFSDLKGHIEASNKGQVGNITRQMTALAKRTYEEHPEFLRGFAPMAWIKAFVNGELR